MKKASFYNELTRNKSLMYTIKYEKNHPVIMQRIENEIMNEAENGQYMAYLDFDLNMISQYDIQMIPKVLDYYGFTSDWHDEDNEKGSMKILTVHWA